MNPAYIMPSLRKMLVELLTELEYSGTGRNKEQGAILLDHLVVRAPRLIRPYMEPILKVSRVQSSLGLILHLDCQVLVPKLREGEPNPGVVISVLSTIGDLAEVTGGHSELQVWMQDLMVRVN